MTFFNYFFPTFSTTRSWSSHFTSCINTFIWGPTNIPNLILASLILGKLFFINPALFFFPLPRRNILESNLDVQWRGIYFSRGDYRRIYYTFLSCNKRFSFRPLFLDVKLFSLPTCRYIFELAQSCCLWLGSHAYCLRYDYIFIGLTCLLSSVWFLFHWTHMLTVFDMITFSFGSHAYYLRYDYIFVGFTCLLSSVWLHFLWAHVLVVFGMITFLLGSHAYCLRYDFLFMLSLCL